MPPRTKKRAAQQAQAGATRSRRERSPPSRQPQNSNQLVTALIGAVVGAALVGGAWLWSTFRRAPPSLPPAPAAEEKPPRTRVTIEQAVEALEDAGALRSVEAGEDADAAGSAEAAAGCCGGCPICLERPRDVALAGCGHTLCLLCFAGLWRRAGADGRDDYCKVKCPFCREDDNYGLRLYNT